MSSSTDSPAVWDQLEKYKVSEINRPSTIYYIPDFVTESEEVNLLKAVYAVPKPKWTQLSNRRLQNWGGLPHPKGMIAEEIPSWLQNYVNRISPSQFDGHAPNHVLVNEYLPGQGIMPHLDGPLFFPTITTLNLGSHTVLNFYHPQDFNNDQESALGSTDRLAYSLLLQPRSLLVLKDDAYTHYLHGIDEVDQDTLDRPVLNLPSCSGITGREILSRTTRVSLTIRYVPNTKKILLKLHK